MMAIDVQAHFMPAAHWQAVADQAEEDRTLAASAGMLLNLPPSSKLRRLDSERVEEMDQAGIGATLISLPPPGVAFGPESGAGERARVINDELIEAAGGHPGRFFVLPSLPFPCGDAALTELDRVADNPLVRGIMIYADNVRFTLDEDRFVPIYQRLCERELPLVLHPSGDPLPAGYQDFRLAAVCQILSSSLSGLRLILSGLLDRLPDLKLLIPHLGGTIPYLAARIDDLAESHAEHKISHYLRERIYTDSCSYFHPALRLASEAFGPNRIMLASDYPFRGPLEVCIEDVKTAGLSAASTEAVLSGNAQELFALAN
jgi:aminocarboxymuconate-semialdehyde decarboxylase